MVRLMHVLIDARVVFEAVNPVDEEVIPDHKHDCRNPKPSPTIVLDIGVKEALSSHLSQKEGKGHDIDPRNGLHRRYNLLSHLVLQETRVVLQTPVKDEVVRKRAEDPVEHGSPKLRNH